MATAPQKPTRNDALSMGAPPARPDTAPRMTRQTSDTSAITWSIGTQRSDNKGSAGIDMAPATMPSLAPRTVARNQPNQQEWLALELRVEKEQQRLQIWIAEDINPLKAAQRRFAFSLLALIAVLIPLLLFLQKLIITREMAVFDAVQQSLKAMQSGADLAFPADLPLEIVGLVNEIEHALQQSAKQLSRSRTAVGNLAHELKRPLQQLHWLAQEPPGPRPELLKVYEQLQAMVTRELRRAVIAGNPSPGQRFNPRDDLTVIGQLLTRQNPNGIALQLNLPAGLMPFDRDDMLELLGNLLDNAWRFAVKTVSVTIQPWPDGQGWECRVEDDGPGLSEADCQLLSQRGVSRDESGIEHHGLGGCRPA